MEITVNITPSFALNRAWSDTSDQSVTPVASACSHALGAHFGTHFGGFRTSVVMPAGYRTTGAVTPKRALADVAALSTLAEGVGRRRWSPPTT